jgi:phage portal protein BeeE
VSFIDRLLGRDPPEDRTRDLRISLDEYASMWMMPGASLGLNQTLLGEKEEPIRRDYNGIAEGAYRQNGVVFACMLVRMMVFSEARFLYQQLREGRPGNLFWKSDLEILENPWPGAQTGDMLTRVIQDVDLAGNWFGVRRPPMNGSGPRIKRLRPDWVTIVAGGILGDVDSEVIGYTYQPGGPGSGEKEEVYLVDEVAHFAPIPDPMAMHRGMSWITPVIRDIMSDGALTNHKLAYFENGATPNLVVKLDREVRKDAFEEWVAKFESRHIGVENAYRTLYLGGGADATVVGSNLEQAAFKQIQGAGETRICMAARVSPVLVGASEGLQGSSLNAGNYSQARRQFADGTMRPLWRGFASAISRLVPEQNTARLWYDDRDIPFLAEDVKDSAQVQFQNAQTIRTLIDGGFTPDEVIDAVTAGDLRRLQGAHSGMLSVQLQEPGAKEELPAKPETVDSTGEQLSLPSGD